MVPGQKPCLFFKFSQTPSLFLGAKVQLLQKDSEEPGDSVLCLQQTFNQPNVLPVLADLQSQASQGFCGMNELLLNLPPADRIWFSHVQLPGMVHFFSVGN